MFPGVAVFPRNIENEIEFGKIEPHPFVNVLVAPTERILDQSGAEQASELREAKLCINLEIHVIYGA